MVPYADGTLSSGLLEWLPGVGAYTGNAIASIACHEPVAVVDANVVRVVSRLRRLVGDPKSKAAVTAQTALADALLDPERPGDFNQVTKRLADFPMILLENGVAQHLSCTKLGTQICRSAIVARLHSCETVRLGMRRLPGRDLLSGALQQPQCVPAGCHGAGRHGVHGAPAAVVFRVPAARRLRGVRRRAG